MFVSHPICKTKEGIWVIEGDTHFKVWIERAGRLDHDRGNLDILCSFIPIGGTVVDCGAYIGDHTIAYLRAVGNRGKVYAFEPNPVAFECLKLNCPSSININAGLGERNEEFSYNLENGNYGASFLSKDDDLKKLKVQVLSLDEIVERDKLTSLDFIKIDAEGFEPFIIKGASETIRRFRPVMCVEVVDGHLRRNGYTRNDLMQMIFDFGYTLVRITKNLTFLDEQYDILAIPNEKTVKDADGLPLSKVISIFKSK